jgi:hypothetical protein
VRDERSWYSIVLSCLSSYVKPTMLFFQQVHPEAEPHKRRLTSYSEFDITETQLMTLEAKVREL